MNRLHYIIDGYNLVHAIPALKKTLSHDGETARELLIHSISQLTHQKKFRCSIVFDGTAPNSSSSPLSADAKIKQMIEHSKNRSLLVIISSDREIVNFAKVCSCQTYSSNYFANMLSGVDDIITEKSDASLTKSQIDEWLKIFGEN
jgi:hypothetical protein